MFKFEVHLKGRYMGYPANTKQWRRGDLVIQIGDAKRDDKMLMHVVGYTREGLARTRYVYPDSRGKQRVYMNDIQYLLDPSDFGIDTTRAKAILCVKCKRRLQGWEIEVNDFSDIPKDQRTCAKCSE